MYTISHEGRYADIEEGPEGWWVSVFTEDYESSAPSLLRSLGPSDNFYLALGVALKEISGKEEI